MENQFERTENLIGKENLEKLKTKKVAVFGIGGVGSFVVEGLARAGIENFILVDNDTISVTNINRQIHSNHNTVGKYKVDEMAKRILDINPNIKVESLKIFFKDENDINFLDIDYIVDAIDSVSSKINLIKIAKRLEIPIISSMGTGNKLNPTQLEVSDISKTSVCPLAKVIRKELRKENINHLKVVYSKEEPIKVDTKTPASISFVPSVAGFIIASEVVKDFIKI